MTTLKYQVNKGESNTLLPADTPYDDPKVGLICVPTSLEDSEGYSKHIKEQFKFKGDVRLSDKKNHWNLYRTLQEMVPSAVDTEYAKYIKLQNQSA